MTSPRPSATISAVLIVKDEEPVLDACLSALAWVDELVVYDTGSTDRTREIAAGYTDRVVEGYWDDDFGAARNRAIDHATGDWVLVVDADEVVQGDTAGLRKQVDGAEGAGIDRFVITVHSGAPDEVQQGGETVNIRLFQRDAYRYSGRLHEQVVPRAAGGVVGGTGAIRNVRLLHSGYTEAAVKAHDKAARNLAIARRDVEAAVAAGEGGQDLAILRANLARALSSAGHEREALALGDELLAEGLMPDGGMVLLAQAMAGAAALLGEDDRAGTWLDVWEKADYSPVWALAARARLAAAGGRADETLELLERIPTTAVDRVGRRFRKHELAEVQVWALTSRGRFKDAARLAVDTARADHVCVGPDDLVRLFVGAGRPLSAVVSAMDDRIWRQYAVWCTKDPTPEARTFLRTMLEVRPADLAVLLCAAGIVRAMDLSELAVWAGDLRRAGLAELCTLVAASQDEERDVRTRALAAAMAVGIYGDARAVPGLEAALAAVPAEDETALVAELEIVAPGLVAVSA